MDMGADFLRVSRFSFLSCSLTTTFCFELILSHRTCDIFCHTSHKIPSVDPISIYSSQSEWRAVEKWTWRKPVFNYPCVCFTIFLSLSLSLSLMKCFGISALAITLANSCVYLCSRIGFCSVKCVTCWRAMTTITICFLEHFLKHASIMAQQFQAPNKVSFEKKTLCTIT